MIKKLAVLVLLGAVSMAPTVGSAALNGASQMVAATKINGSAPVIRLASNGILPSATGNREITTKSNSRIESATQSSNIPAQAWLIVTALFCFVMRSSRRVV